MDGKNRRALFTIYVTCIYNTRIFYIQQSGPEINKNIALTLVMTHSKNITEILTNNVYVLCLGKITSHLHIILVIKFYTFRT